MRRPSPALPLLLALAGLSLPLAGGCADSSSKPNSTLAPAEKTEKQKAEEKASEDYYRNQPKGGAPAR